MCLQTQLATVTQAEQRIAIVTILSQQQRAAITASSGLSYAADAIEPASVPEIPSSWSPTLWVLIFTAGGFVLGCLLPLVEWRRRPSPTSVYPPIDAPARAPEVASIAAPSESPR